MLRESSFTAMIFITLKEKYTLDTENSFFLLYIGRLMLFREKRRCIINTVNWDSD